jgi:indole-3-glycerol phosphate synthase
VLRVEEHEGNGDLERIFEQAIDLGLDCVVAVRDEDELRLALDRVDPEIFLLSAVRVEGDGLEHVLSLLQDVPAGKLAVAELDVRDRDEVAELERAGVDAVIVPFADVARLVGSPAPEV